MRVLQFPSWYLPEGGQFCLHQSKALQERGVEVHILANVVLPWRKYKLSIFKYPNKPFFTTENGIPMLRYYAWKYPMLDVLNIQKWVYQTVQLFEMYKQEYGLPDIIHVHSSMWAGLAAAQIKEKYGVPYVITEHRGIFALSCNFSKSALKEAYTPFLTKAFSNADYIIPVSKQLKEGIKPYLQKDVTIKSISNIVDVDFFHLKERNAKPDGIFTFVSVNGFWRVKAYDILLPAFDVLCDTYPNVQLRIVGENFELKTFQKLFRSVRHKDKISFSGEVDREGVRQELWNADAFVIASRVESQSVATLEALSTGLPVVATTVVPEEMIPVSCGYRVPVENVEALTLAMSSLIENRESFVAAEISERTTLLASKEVVAIKIIEVYNQVLSE